MNRTITFVSLGPGEPELITLKGLKTLQQADRIFCPATLTTSGKQTSRAAHILQALEIEEEKIHPFVLPMSKDRQKAIEAYDQLLSDAIRTLQEASLLRPGHRKQFPLHHFHKRNCLGMLPLPVLHDLP